MKKLIIHAGFPKCASTTIFDELKSQLPVLLAYNTYVFNRDFDLPRNMNRLMPPLWELADCLQSEEKGQLVRRKIAYQIEHSPENSTLILSTEVLSNGQLAKLFRGFDRRCAIEVLFYFRPQIEWIASAWKQWDIKQGVPIKEAIENCLKSERPGYLNSVRAWKEALPEAKVVARPMLERTLVGGSPVDDFFHFAGLPAPEDNRRTEASNQSIDYALLHLLKNVSGRMFRDRHDNRAIQALIEYLPSQYKKNRTPIINQDYAQIIYDHYLDENIQFVSEFVGHKNPEAFVRSYFLKTGISASYMEMPEEAVLQRAQSILRQAAQAYPEMRQQEILHPLFQVAGVDL